MRYFLPPPSPYGPFHAPKHIRVDLHGFHEFEQGVFRVVHVQLFEARLHFAHTGKEPRLFFALRRFQSAVNFGEFAFQFADGAPVEEVIPHGKFAFRKFDLLRQIAHAGVAFGNRAAVEFPLA